MGHLLALTIAMLAYLTLSLTLSWLLLKESKAEYMEAGGGAQMPLTKQRTDLHKRHCPCKPWRHSRILQVSPCMPSDSSWVLILTLVTSL